MSNKNIKIAYADKNGRLVHISEVARGVNCGCTCPACGSRVVARKGSVRTAHFSHVDRLQCDAAHETVLHLLAKEIIQKSEHIIIPSYNFQKSKKTKFGKKIEHKAKIVPGGNVQIDNVKIEYEGKQQGFVPDIIITSKGRDLLFEVCVSHKVDKSKLKKVRRTNIPMIEIELDPFDITLPRSEVSKIIIDDTKQKKWLFHPRQREAEKVFYDKLKSLIHQSIKDRRAYKKSMQHNDAQISYNHKQFYSSCGFHSASYSSFLDRLIYEFVEKTGRAPTEKEVEGIKRRYKIKT